MSVLDASARSLDNHSQFQLTTSTREAVESSHSETETFKDGAVYSAPDPRLVLSEPAVPSASSIEADVETSKDSTRPFDDMIGTEWHGSKQMSLVFRVCGDTKSVGVPASNADLYIFGTRPRNSMQSPPAWITLLLLYNPRSFDVTGHEWYSPR